MKSRLHIWGVIGTIGWLGAVGIYAVHYRSDILKLAPNEIGDFFAGAFAPLAFFWLVLGFFQQGQELRNSARALWLQGQELQNSVEQQRELVNVTRQQLAFENEVLKSQQLSAAAAARPIFGIMARGSEGDQNGMRRFRFALVNHGRQCTNVRLDLGGDSPRTVGSLDSGGRFEFVMSMSGESSKEIVAKISYIDSALSAGNQSIIITKMGAEFQFARPLSEAD